MKTNKNISNIALCALLALALPGLAAAQQIKTLTGHVPRAISRFHLQSIGDLPADTNLNLAISLPVRNEQNLDALLAGIYDPASTNYHHYLKHGEFAQRFGPSTADYQKVIDFANANNLTVIRSYSNQMLLDVSGKVSDIENAFHVRMRTYHHPTENRNFYAPDTEPSIDAALPIGHVTGLNNFIVPHPLLVQKPKASLNKSLAGAGPLLGSGVGGSYMGNDFRAAYVPGVTLDGSGQTIGLVEFDGYYTADILSYEAQAGLANITLTNVPVDGGVGTPGGGDVEVSLDIEMDISMATNLSKVVVYESTYDIPAHAIDMFNRIASDDLATTISASWVLDDDPGYDVYYKQMALQGQSFFLASGDEGAFYPGIFQWSDDTNVTIVGGTTLSTTGPGGAWSSETVWNWNSTYGIDAGSGGGTNINGVPIPFWQQNVPMTQNQGSTTLRNVPDVALTADNIYVVCEDGQFTIVGGTSCAAPLWAAFTALVNQQANNRGFSPVGFLNPAIYSIGLNPTLYATCFHDIITGNNTNLVVGNAYFAVPGYDLATGWGTPNGANLINALTASAPINYYTHLSPPPPPYGANLVGLNGGNPNGKWELFVVDTQNLNHGAISNGYSITLTTGNPIGFVADDALTMTPSAVTLLTNADVTFNIGLENWGPQTSSNVVVSDSLPVGFSLVNATTTNGTVSFDGQQVVWTLGNMGDQTTGQLTLILQAPNELEQVQNVAAVTASTPSDNSADSSASALINVVAATAPTLGSGALGAGGLFHLSIGGGSQVPVVIQASTNLVKWVNIATNTPPFIFTDTVDPVSPTRFYRALVQ